MWQLIAFLLAATGFKLDRAIWRLPCGYGIVFRALSLFKKMVNIGSITGLTLETLLTCTFAVPIGYVIHTGSSSFGFSLVRSICC